MRLTGDIPLVIEGTDPYNRLILNANVFLPTDGPENATVSGEWGPGIADAADRMNVSDMYIPEGLRHQGIASRLTRTLIRHVTTIDPRITVVEAWCTSPESLQLMHRILPDNNAIFETGHEPTAHNTLTLQRALGIMALWEPIPPERWQRSKGISFKASLAGVDMSNWELPKRV